MVFRSALRQSPIPREGYLNNDLVALAAEFAWLGNGFYLAGERIASLANARLLKSFPTQRVKIRTVHPQSLPINAHPLPAREVAMEAPPSLGSPAWCAHWTCCGVSGEPRAGRHSGLYLVAVSRLKVFDW